MTLAWKRWIPVAFLVGALGAWTFGGRALAQPQPQPGQPQPQLQPRPLPPGMQPQPGQPMPGQPGMPQRPPRPGFPPGGQPLPPGHPAVPGGGMRPPTPAPAHAEDEPHKGGHEAECPGHGPMDPPAHINWWEGILMVNNDRAGNPDAKVWERLLFRYENPKDPCDPKNLPAPFLASLLNFGLLAFVIVRFGKKPVAEALVKRRESIMQEIDNAAKLRQEAKSRLRDYKRKFETLEETLAELRAEYRQQAEGEKKRVLAEAEERRARLVRDAEFRVEQERKAAHVELLHEAAVGAVGAAEKLLEKRIAAADHERLADEYLASVVGAVRTARQAAPGGRA